jgi:hypothetical protein
MHVQEGDRDYGVDYYYNASLLQNKLSDILELQTTAGDISATPARVRYSPSLASCSLGNRY